MNTNSSYTKIQSNKVRASFAEAPFKKKEIPKWKEDRQKNNKRDLWV